MKMINHENKILIKDNEFRTTGEIEYVEAILTANNNLMDLSSYRYNYSRDEEKIQFDLEYKKVRLSFKSKFDKLEEKYRYQDFKMDQYLKSIPDNNFAIKIKNEYEFDRNIKMKRDNEKYELIIKNRMLKDIKELRSSTEDKFRLPHYITPEKQLHNNLKASTLVGVVVKINLKVSENSDLKIYNKFDFKNYRKCNKELDEVSTINSNDLKYAKYMNIEDVENIKK
jgi:hypothetical protein